MSSNYTNKLSKYKFLFLLLNGIWFLFGLVFVLIGTLLKTNYKLIIGEGMDMVIKEVPNSTVVIFIAVGGVIVLVSVFGNCATAMNDYRMLYSFCVINVLLFIVQCITIGLALRFTDQLEVIGKKRITNAIKEYNWSDNQNRKYLTAVDNLQYILHCCGAQDWRDWQLNERFNRTTHVFPYSCCRELKNHLSECTVRSVNRIGCIEAISDKYRYRVLILVAVSVFVCFLQIILLVIGIKLAKQLTNYETI